MAIVVILSQNNTISTTLTLYDAEDLAAAGTPKNAKFSYFTSREKRCCQGVCTRLTDDTTRTIPRIFLVLLYNSHSLNLMISLSGEWVLNFRFASTPSLCVQRQTLEIFSTDSLFFLLLHKCTTTLFLYGPC